jgi:hypothetical protein
MSSRCLLARLPQNSTFTKPSARAGALIQRIREADGYRLKRINEAEGDVARFSALLAEYIKAPVVTLREADVARRQSAETHAVQLNGTGWAGMAPDDRTLASWDRCCVASPVQDRAGA